jgi:hypothetical protein
LSSPSQDRVVLRARILLLGAVASIAAMLWLDSSSIERGNRLFRAGERAEAERVYRPQAERDTGSVDASYNLGTALLSSNAVSAEEHLRRAALSADSSAAQRGSYNLTYSLLIRVNTSTHPDTAIALVSEAVESGRRALKLNPADEDAVWNLALAQRMLDSLTVEMRLMRREEDPGKDETRIEDNALTRSGTGEGQSGLEPPNPRPAENIGRRTGASVGAREAWTSQDPGPIDLQSARSLIDPVRDSPEDLLRGILWSLRPQVEWWNLQQYPGGNW